MTLSQAWKAFKESMYAFWIYREPEPFSYIRDVGEMTSSTTTPKNTLKE